MPYDFITGKILRIISYFKIQPGGSIYYDLPEKEDNKKKFTQLVDMYKDMLLKEDEYSNMKPSNFNYYDCYSNFSRQIRDLCDYNHPKYGYRIYHENWPHLIGTAFEVYMKSNRNDARKSISYFNADLKTISTKSKIPDQKTLNMCLLQKLIECTQFLNDNWQKIDELPINKKLHESSVSSHGSFTNSCLEFYDTFTRSFISYIVNEVKDIKNCCKPCIDLLLALAKNAHQSTDYLTIIEYLLNKNDFYVLKDYTKETKTLTSLLLNLAYEFVDIIDFDNNQKSKTRHDIISKIYDKLKDKILKFPECVQTIQEILFDKTFCKPIEMNVQNEKFFYLITYNLFQPVFDPKSVYNVKGARERMTKTVSLIVSSGIFESLQPEECSASNITRLRYYKAWFSKIGLELIKTESEFDAKFIDHLCQLIDECIKMDNYINEFDSSSYTINMDIVESLSWAFLNPNVNEKLINDLIKVWIILEEKNNEDLKKKFLDKMSWAQINHLKLLLPVSTKFWDLYLENINEYRLLSIVNALLPLNYEFFMKNYSEKYIKKILERVDEVFTINYQIFLTIAKYCPRFYFQLEKNLFYLTELIESLKRSNADNLMGLSAGILFAIIKELNENANLLKELHLKIFEHRKEFWKIIFEERIENGKSKYELFKTKDYPMGNMISMPCEIYFMLVKNFKPSDGPKNVKILIDELLEYLSFEKSVLIVDTIRKIGEFENKVYLGIIKNYRNVFEDIKTKNSKDPDLVNCAQGVLDLIDGRNMETFSTKLNENEVNITKINVDLVEKGKEIKKLDKNVKENKQKIITLKKDVVQINGKLAEIDKKLEQQNLRMDKLDEKTLFNMPIWCTELKSSLEKNQQDWILIAKRLNFSNKDIKGWLNQIDPFMSMLNEWFIANKTSDAINGLLKVFRELNNRECVRIIQNNIDKIESESKNSFKDYNIDDKLKANPSQVFICYEWSSKEKAELLRKYLFEQLNKECGVKNINDDKNENIINIWFDDGNMGGGIDRNKRIDLGLRLCNVLVCLISSEINKDQTCLNQINLAIQLNKPIIPLLLDSKLKWPPSGSLGPILSEYLFIRFFQRPPKELTNDERYWPLDKFNELSMCLKQLIPFSLTDPNASKQSNATKTDYPEVFISYQWDRQKQIIKLYEKLTKLGLKCWLDIHQMAGGDSLYFKIDEGIRNCSVVISCVTMKYSLSANCRKEIGI